MQILSLKNIITFSLIIFSSIIVRAQEDTNYYKLKQVLEYIDNKYVDTVDIKKKVEEVIISTLKELDPHSTYISKEEVEEVNQPLIGNFEGIGVYFNILQDTIVIISTISGGPSEKVGIKAGDRIIEVEGENIANIGITNEGVKERLLGEKGTKVRVGIKRKNVTETLEFTITRDQIPIFSIDAAYMIEDEIGYIKLNKFSATSKAEFIEAVEKLEKEGLKNLIFDLRQNGGGYLSASVEIADQFLKKDQLMVYTEGINSEKKEYFATSDGEFEKGRLVVLIDEGTASASEIVSGALQDWDRAVLIGRRSYGKGLVQRPFNLVDGSIIRLTIARYYTPTGRLIQKSYDEGVDKYKSEIENRFSNGELLNSDSISFLDSLKYYTLEKNRLVYGGGGIMPDIFVPLDTTKLPDFYTLWLQNGIISDFILKYTDNNREIINSKYADFNDFNKKYSHDNNFYEELIQFAKSELKSTDTIDINNFKNEEYINLQLKSLIARDLWTENEYYQVINSINSAYNQAIEIIKNKTLYEEKLNSKK